VCAPRLFMAVDAQGNIYGAEVGPKDVKKYVRK
jgi:hypothetical protein